MATSLSISLRDKMRVCMVTPVSITLRRSRSGEYYGQGVGARQITEAIQFIFQAFVNISGLVLTTENDECMNRLVSNQSDFTTTVVPFYHSNDIYKISVPMFTHRTTIFSGYNATDASLFVKETVTAMSNFVKLFHRSIYLVSVALMLSLMLYVMIKARVMQSLLRSSRSGPSKHKLRYMLKSVLETLRMRSRNFRWIVFLLSILSFFLITTFTILFQTSQVIHDLPHPIDSYKALLSYPSAVPGFYNSMAKVSDAFKSAKKGTIQHEVWNRLIELSKPIESHIYNGFDIDPKFVDAIKTHVREMSANRHVIILSTMTLGLLKSFFCSLSPEEELWRLLEFHDPSEGQILMGYPMRVEYDAPLSRKLRRIFDTHVAEIFYKRTYDIRDVGYSLLSTSRKHQSEQDRICSQSFRHEETIIVSSVDYNFYDLFIRILLCIICFAFLSLIGENIIYRLNAKKRRAKLSPRRRRKMRFSHMIDQSFSPWVVWSISSRYVSSWNCLLPWSFSVQIYFQCTLHLMSALITCTGRVFVSHSVLVKCSSFSRGTLLSADFTGWKINQQKSLFSHSH